MPRAQTNQPDVIDVTPRASHTSRALATTSAANMPTPERLRTLLAQLSAGIVAREPALKIALLTLLAGENIVLIGPPGTGKSMVSRRVADALGAGDGAYFEYLLTKFSTPEEIFGPLSLAALKNDRFERRIEGYLPSVRVAFLDEIFKASSSILNALLTILNERIYHNGPRADKVPLRALIAASNELPTGQSELAALYDRFLVRHFVGYVDKGERRDLFNAITTAATTSASQAIEPLTAAELTAIDTAARAVTLPAPIVQALTDIWAAHEATFSENRDEHLSDRRMTKVLHLLRVSAATNGRSEVNLSDLMLLHHCLWNHDANREAVHKLITDTLKKHSRPIVLQAAPSAQPSPKTANEVSGVSAAPSAVKSAALIPTTRSAQPTGQLGALFKNMKGRGTADDPLLIETVDDLSDLALPEIGQKGYHFLQVNDLDLSGLSVWKSIDFQGYYDGNGKDLNCNRLRLFNEINKSVIKKINFKNGFFATMIRESNIENLSLYSYSKVSCIQESNIVGIEIIYSKIEEFIKCNVANLNAANSILGSAAASHFSTMEITKTSFKKIQSCSVDNLLMLDSPRICITRGGAKDVSISNAIIFNKKSFDGLFYRADNVEFTNTVCIFENNINFIFHKIDRDNDDRAPWLEGPSTKNNCYTINLGTQSYNTQGATPLDFKLFTKRFIKTCLGFDVENIWDCDNMVDGIPQLRFTTQLGLSSANTQTQTKTKVKAAQSQAPTVDLLFHQLKQNIWV